MVPDPSRTSLGLEYFLWDKDEEWQWPQEQLIDRGIRECVQIGLIQPHEVEDGTIVRMPKAYPVYDQRYQQSVATLHQYLENLVNLQTIGRNGLHRYNNQDHSMLTGVYAAWNVAGGHYDVWSVNTEMEYHEEGQVAEPGSGDRIVPAPVAPAVTSLTASDEVIEAAFAKLDPVALGVAVGIVGALVLFFTTTILLLKGGPVVGPNLSLLEHYLFGFQVTWSGAVIGLIEAGISGFILGYIIAWLRNWGINAYADLLRRRAEADARRDLLDKI